MGLLVLALRRTSVVRSIAADRRTRAILALAACLITVNWAVYIWGVNNGHVVETSLGYFVNPLVTVLMGVFILGERLRRWQWAALAVARARRGRPDARLRPAALDRAHPGAHLRQLRAVQEAGERAGDREPDLRDAVIGPVALAYLGWLTWHGESNFADHGAGHVLLLMSAGIVTAVPLVCFGGAAIRVPLVTLGLLQYLTPTLQFVLGVLYFHEDMPAGRWVGFGLVWVALAILTVESLRHRHTSIRLAAAAATPDGSLAPLLSNSL